MQKENFISVILPCYNECGNIIPLIELVHKELNFCQHQIIVVDDNSPDGTFEVVRSKNYDFVKAILRTSEPGLAKSIRCGIENADGNIYLIMDSDFNHQPQYIPQLVKNIEFFDCVSGSRYLYGGGMYSPRRYFLSKIFNIYVKFITRTVITDSLSGFFAIRKDALKSLNFDKVFYGYGEYYIRLLYVLQREKAKILEIPTIYGSRLSGESNSRFLRIFIIYSLATIKLIITKSKIYRK